MFRSACIATRTYSEHDNTRGRDAAVGRRSQHPRQPEVSQVEARAHAGRAEGAPLAEGKQSAVR